MSDDDAWPNRPVSPEQAEKAARSLSQSGRAKLMGMLAMRPGAGVSELAGWSGLSTGVVRRHLNTLVKEGMVEVESYENRRGVAKRHYANVVEPVVSAEQTAMLSRRDRRLQFLGVLRLLFDEATRALRKGTATAQPEHVMSTLLAEVDTQGWRELAELHHEALRRTKLLVDESRRRREQSGEESMAVLAGMVLVEYPPLVDQD